jgi:hypothetical protein
MPKGRTVCYLCEECRNIAIYNEPIEVEIENYLGQIGEDDEI